MSDALHTGHGPRSRLTRRGRLFLAIGLCVVLALIAVLVTRLLGGPGQPPLTIPEGWRATQVYAAADKALGVAPGTTKKAATRARLKLPEAAKGDPEGFLYPATYPVDDDTTPESLLSFMTNTAAEKHAADGIRAYETVITASIVQAEADRPADMGKVARVIENRLDRGMPLQMDSTINYALGRSSLNTSHTDTKLNSPYNTYRHKGLPPTPIDNPGQDALRAAARPPAGDWLYFVTVAPGDTRFTADYAQHRANVREFNERHGR